MLTEYVFCAPKSVNIEPGLLDLLEYVAAVGVFLDTVGDFTFWLRLSLRLSLSLNFGLSTYLSQKVKWFHWAKTWRLTRLV